MKQTEYFAQSFKPDDIFSRLIFFAQFPLALFLHVFLKPAEFGELKCSVMGSSPRSSGWIFCSNEQVLC